MLGIAFLVLLVVSLLSASLLGWTTDSRQAGRYWYPAGPDPEPWRTD